MAICYARLGIVKRSQGKNPITKSAYNGKLRLEFEGNSVLPPETYDWSKKGDKPLFHGILLPIHVDQFFSEPGKLWNSVDKAEKRKDAQVGKELVIALPDDKIISDERRIELAKKFAEKYFVSKGYGVQVDVHHPNRYLNYNENDGKIEEMERNYHAHILITERSFAEDGKGFANVKINNLLPEIRGSNHFAFGGLEWRKLWTQFQNKYFEERGLDLRVDQNGVESQIHLGPVRMRGKRAHEILDLNEKRIELGLLLSQDPNIILQKLTENKSTFIESDVEMFFQKHLPESEISKVREAFWKNSKLVQLFDTNTHKATDKFTSTDVYNEERQILRLADGFNKRYIGAPIGSNLSQLSLKNLNDEQKEAFYKVINGNSISCIEGLAGTGKSYLLVALKDHYESQGYKVRAFGPDNAAVKVIKDKGFKDSKNIHTFLFKNHFSKKNAISPSREIWIIDESGKVSNPPLLEMLKLAEKNGVHLIFSGNSAQLSSVERGGMFKVFCERYGCSYLKNIQRQKSEVHRDISKHLAQGEASKAIDMISRTGGFVWSRTKEESLLRVVEKWADDRLNFPDSSSLIIAYTNTEVRQLNDLVHTIRQARKEVAQTEFSCRTTTGTIRVSEGDTIVFRSNSNKLKVFNGQRGTLVTASENEFVVLSEGKRITFNPKQYNAFQLGYARTFDGSQGDTVDRCYILYSNNMHLKPMYVANSRHIRNVHCFVSKTDASCLTDLKRQVSRKVEERNTLAYTTMSEIDKLQKKQDREKNIDELCSSDGMIAKSKGYGLKIWETLKSQASSVAEHVQDRRADKNFYKTTNSLKEGGGRVVEIQEEKISLKNSAEGTPKFPGVESNKIAATNPSFKKLSDEKKSLYKKYFEKVETASSLYAIVQSESLAKGINIEVVPSYSAWQKACGERNASAFDLLRGGEQHKAILSQKGYEILQDQAMRHEKMNQPKDHVESQLNENIEGVLYKLFPEGPSRKDSKGFRFGSKGSLSVTCVGEKKGCFYDHENKEGGNLLQLIQKKERLSKSEAIDWARSFLKDSSGRYVPSHFSTASFSKSKEDNWISLSIPSEVKMPLLSSISPHLDANYLVVATYPYYAKGQLVCYTMRLESKIDGGKIVLPLSYGKTHQEGSPKWSLKRYSTTRELLYNSQFLEQYPAKPVLIVEGEKTADAAHKLFGKDYVVISWLGGAAAGKNADWQQLYGRNIVIWPDNDPAGFKAASEISNSLRQVGVKSLKVVPQEALKDLPPKWDLADPLPQNKALSFVNDCLLRAESKAVGVERLVKLAEQHGKTISQINEVVSSVDNQLRSDLEKKHGSKTWEIEDAILKEASKLLKEDTHSSQSRGIKSATPSLSNDLEKVPNKFIERDR